MTTEHPIFFDIKRYALHDGPSIRTTVFFKGCPLRCIWCHNPEGIRPGLEVVTVAERCIGCRECLDGCPETALSMESGGIVRDRGRCGLHLNCVEICPSLAHEAMGWQSSIDEIMEEIEKDRPFFDESGGGVTFSGGEPLFQAEHLIALLKRCGEMEIHRTVDTSGYADIDTLLEVAGHTDLFLYDLKHMDRRRHEALTGVDNGGILDNLRRLNDMRAHVRVRFPLIGSVNDDRQNLDAMGRFLSELDYISEVDLLIFHRLAAAKYRKLDREDLSFPGYAPSADSLADAKEILEGYGLSVRFER
ncbi:MAG: glycyl-radical enzyme activating protein [Desulfofustis sp.]|nr:glycyl-radical enzyme activating protein [Desulfofustis sp.]